jgi:TonB-dependent SusC/RagA subfamily outer membrane receptor
MIKYIRTIAVILLFAPAGIYAQTTTVSNKALIAFQDQGTRLPAEKVYLHLDKSYYTAGDTIWFKAYTVVGPLHQLSAISHVLNVELISGSNKIVKALKLVMPNGITNGDIILPDSLQAGTYHVRAYTNWMRNYNIAYFYNVAIKVANTLKNNVFTKTTYAYSSQNNQPVINAHITYVNLNGEPYMGRNVKYSLMQNNRPIISGTGITDNAGNINITASQPATSSALNLIATIQLSGSTVTKEFALTPTVNQPDVQFFPEGGTLVNETASKVAFKAIAPNGLGTEVKGTLTDDQATVITTFNSTHLGMGTFIFTPHQGRTYKAKIDFSDGRTNVINLPKATDSGYVLNINNSNDATVDVKIISVNVPGDVTLVGQAANVIFFAGKGTPGKSMFTASIPKEKFPTGIVQFTLFSAAGEPLNERLVFINNHDQLKLNINTDKSNYGVHDKVKIDLNAGAGIRGSFSAAVINESLLPVDEDTETTILSSLLLTSDVAGYIERPNYYFNNENDKTRADLDVLMLTQGYHRFEWKQLANAETKPITYQPEHGLTVSGRVVDRNNKPVAGGKVSLFSLAGANMLDTLTNSEGRFVFDNIDFTDGTKVTIKAVTAQNSSKVKILIDEAPQPNEITNTDDMAVNIIDDDAARLSYLQSINNAYNEKLTMGLTDGTAGIMLKEVSIKSIRTKALKYSANLNGPGNANQVIYADNLFKGCLTFADCMAGRLTGVNFDNPDRMPASPKNQMAPTSKLSDTGELNTQYMAVVYNGVLLKAEEILPRINMNDIAAIEVLRSAQYLAIYGSRASNGVIIITTKHGDTEINMDLDAPQYVNPYSGLYINTPKGYYKTRQFYSPRYGADIAPVPDTRSTIYWAPLLLTDNSGHSTFEYFNAGSKGSYRVVVEGIDNNGRIGRQVYHYNVQ